MVQIPSVWPCGAEKDGERAAPQVEAYEAKYTYCHSAGGIRETAAILKELGCSDEQIKIAALSMCGVPIQPVNTQSAMWW